MLEGCVPWPEEFARRYRREGYWLGRSLAELFDTWCSAHPERTALVCGSRRWTYRELHERVARTAGGLRQRGLGSGDRVLVQLPNTAEFVTALCALLRIGAIPVLALTSHRRAELLELCRVSEAVAHLVPDWHRGHDHREEAARVRADAGGGLDVIVDGDPGAFTRLADVTGPPAPAAATDPGEVALFLLSGGTTGRSKLIPRTHDDYAYNVRITSDNAGLTPDDVYLCVLPASHNYALGCPGVLGALSRGATVVLSDSADAEDAFALVEEEGVTVTALVPSLAALWTEAADLTHRDLSTLRLVQVGGSRASADDVAETELALGCRVQQSFGMGEGILSQSGPDDSFGMRTTTQGRPLSPADEVRVVDEDDRPLPVCTTGRLQVRGPYTIRGYYRAEEANAAAFTPDGFLRTGDLARLTSYGHLVVEGRTKDVINRAGDKIAAAEVEDALTALPSVRSCAVVAVPDPLLGEASCAFLVCSGPPPSSEEVSRHLRSLGLAAFKVPDRIENVAELPLTRVGKVDKEWLRRGLEDAADRGTR
ncbi:(2,3-dihydroxybenzoyl)adenylate synthase [Nocardiopsis dassonvillei]|uniref:(2,3-dihydroxybenzoyl)adenylate synthase n=1 Tax=Nocardiopsis dassonvillei TaxID=2014 RepID=UPI0036FD6BA7